MSLIASTSFTLKTELEEEFISRWRALALFLIQQPGFLRVHLNRSLERRGHFLLIAEWASQGEYREAMSQPQLTALVRDFPADYQISLYEPVVGLVRPNPPRSLPAILCFTAGLTWCNIYLSSRRPAAPRAPNPGGPPWDRT